MIEIVVIEIESIVGFASVQDGGRPGHMHEGVPPGGALVPERLATANAAARNPPGAAAIEFAGTIAVTARGSLLLGTDAGATHALGDGETRAFAGKERFVHYLAVRGGLDVPRVLGGRGTLVVAALGGHEGRPLRRGDRLPVGGEPPDAAPARSLPETPRGPVRVVLGPDLYRFDANAIDVLLGSTFLVDARSDRVGTRLSGPRLVSTPEPAAASAPMVRGAIQVPPSGEAIVLGPDHPTTGGYPVIATVVHAHLGSLASLRVGATVRFAS